MTLGSRRWKGLRSRFVSLPGMRNLVGLPSEPEPDPLLFMALRSSRSVAELRSSRSVTELRSSRSGTERSLRERRSLCPRSLIKPLILSPSRSWTRFLQKRTEMYSQKAPCSNATDRCFIRIPGPQFSETFRGNAYFFSNTFT